MRVPPGVRPTGGRARGALFDVWSSHVPEARFLDLFAGSGAVGLEALSRGAAFCLAVEGDRRVFGQLEAGYQRLVAGESWRLRRLDLPSELSRLENEDRFDLVFADPPYDFEGWSELLAAIARVIGFQSKVALEHGRRNRPPEDPGILEFEERRAYGESELSFYSSPLLARPR